MSRRGGGSFDTGRAPRREARHGPDRCRAGRRRGGLRVGASCRRVSNEPTSRRRSSSWWSARCWPPSGLGRHAARRRRRSPRWSRSPWCGCSSPTPPASASQTSATTSVVRRLLAVGLPLTLLAGWALAAWLFPGARRLAGAAGGRRAGAHRRGTGRPGGDQPGGAVPGASADHRGERPQRRDRHPGRHARDRRGGLRGGAAPTPGPRGAGRAGDRRRSSGSPWASPAGGCCGGPAARAGPPRSSRASPSSRSPWSAYAAALTAARERVRRRVLRRPGVRRRGRPAGTCGAGRSSSRRAAWSPCSCGWRSAPSPCRSCWSASTWPWCCTPC